MFQDKTLDCKDCGAQFVFTVSEQEFFAEKGFTNNPGRCPSCRAARKQNSRGVRQSNDFRTQREMHTVTCASCGESAQVPFKPSSDRPVYCKDCFSSQKRYVRY
mgnify:CR=1 FL=1